jgi:Holliday junction DNA helicase RuvA
MISAIHGSLEQRGAGWAQVRVGSVSLKVFLPLPTLSDLGAAGSEIHLHTHLIFKEDNIGLYGFATPEELSLFQTLITVSGVGPRLALAILSVLNSEQLALAIASGNPDAISGVPGVGKKTAGRIILELKGKLEKEWLAEGTPLASGSADLLAALSALGYSASEATHAVSQVTAPPNTPLEERVRQTLQYLGDE